MFKYEFGIIPIALHNLLEEYCSVHTYYTRHGNKLLPALAKHAYRDKDCTFISVHAHDSYAFYLNVTYDLILYCIRIN